MSELPPPGWYPDVDAPGHERWWDGREWSSVTREAARPVPQDTSPYAPVVTVRPVPVGYGLGPSLPNGADGVSLASWGRRAVAWTIDYVIVWAIVLPLAWDELSAMWSEANRRATAAAETGAAMNPFALAGEPAFAENYVNVVLSALAVSALLQVVFVAMRGATPGMHLLGLRVRRIDGPEPPSWGRSFVRWMVGYVPFLGLGILGSIFWLLDVAFPLWDPRRQALHDKAAKTLVVRVR